MTFHKKFNDVHFFRKRYHLVTNFIIVISKNVIENHISCSGQCPCPTRVSRKFKRAPQKSPVGHCLAPLSIVRILNLSSTARFLGDPYKYSSTSNGSPLLATAFSCGTSSFSSFSKANLTLP
jgi:hypothetical protein